MCQNDTCLSSEANEQTTAGVFFVNRSFCIFNCRCNVFLSVCQIPHGGLLQHIKSAGSAEGGEGARELNLHPSLFQSATHLAYNVKTQKEPGDSTLLHFTEFAKHFVFLTYSLANRLARGRGGKKRNNLISISTDNVIWGLVLKRPIAVWCLD